MQDDTVDLTEVGRNVGARWPKVVFITLLFGLVAALITWVIPPVYQAQANILIPQMEATGTSMQLLQLKAGSDPVAILVGVIESHTSHQKIAAATGKKLEEVKAMLKVEGEQASSQVIVKGRDNDSETALKAVKLAVQNAKDLDANVGLSVAGLQAKNLKPSVDSAAAKLREAEEALLDYQQNSKIVFTPDDQYTGVTYLKKLQELAIQKKAIDNEIAATKSLVTKSANELGELPTNNEAFKNLRDSLLQAETDLAVARSKFTDKNTAVVQAREKRDAVKKILEVEARKYAQAVGASVNEQMLSLQVKKIVVDAQVQSARKLAEQAPTGAVDFQRLLRKVRTLTEAYNQVNTRYLQAQVESQASRVKWIILDEPYLLEKPINKSYKINIGATMLLGLLVGIAWVSRK
jgi:uncharacterized protein involved in exopolysaccharide biosynthesis